MILTTDEKKYQLTKELLDQMRSVDGFPLGKDEDIIALSDPPCYTACPSPWIEEFIKENGKPWDPRTDSYNREPFAVDVSEGKTDPIYLAHSYHTKVPYRAIMRYILHYTEPGDIVFDGFCGTGMTGVAAQMCEKPDPEFKEKIEREMPYVKWGCRKAILNDLSPAAALISYNFNAPVNVKEFGTEANKLLQEIIEECTWMYETRHVVEGKVQFSQNIDGEKSPVKGKINYTLWSDVYACPNCSEEIVFWDVAVDKIKAEVRDEFVCPHCNSLLSKDPKKDPKTKKTKAEKIEHVWESVFDHNLNKTIQQTKQIPVLINYSIIDSNGRYIRFEKIPDSEDLSLIKDIDSVKNPYWYPDKKIPDGEKTKEPMRIGITHIHHFYTKRNLYILSKIFQYANKSKSQKILFMFTSMVNRASKMNRLHLKNYINKSGGCNAGYLKGTIYISSISIETSIIEQIQDRIAWLSRCFSSLNNNLKTQFRIETNSSTALNICDNSVDYLFIDPPFGYNIQYSELNFLWEYWIKVQTNNTSEAVINSVQRKGLSEYQDIMERCFKEFYRILKPGRWMTVEFHNSQNSVWMSIQEALQSAGFVVADVRTLDKKQGAFNQVQATKQAVKQDLIISAYKPNGGLEDRFKLTAGTIDGVWDFIRQHLKHLPVFVEKEGIVQVIIERQKHLLYDRMIAFHVQRGVRLPISAGDFFVGLKQRFPEREGMFFLENQVLEFDKGQMGTKKVEQYSLFVHDEKSTVQWLQKVLIDKSQTYQEIQPKFLQELHLDKFEKMPELTALLEQNFIQDSQGKWYVPDDQKQSDLDKVREKALLKEFEEYKKSKGKLKIFRTEAIRAGFKKAWSDGGYNLIISIGERLPPQIIQEDADLLMYYDNALTRSGKT